MRMMIQMSLVAAGSALGGVTRWGATVVLSRWLGTAFPYATLAINVSGSLFLGWLATVLAERAPGFIGGWIRPDDLRLLVAVGFTGSFTTFSTMEYEAHSLARDGGGGPAFAYLVVSMVLGLLAVRLGVTWGSR